MKSFCPTCLTEREVEYVAKPETFVVRDEPVKVESTVAVCRECGNEIFDMAADEANIRNAYAAYRAKHGLLSPEEIKSIREAYGLSQRALARVLGWGLVTIQRYEQGALQDPNHDAMLRKVSEDPSFLYHQFEKNRDQFSEPEAIRIGDSLAGRVIKHRTDLTVNAYVTADGIAYSRDKNSRGFHPFEYGRFAQVVAHLTVSVPDLFKTKLAKLLWLSDFYYYALSGTSITGLAYSRLPYGPAPDQFQLLLGFLESNGVITLTPHEFGSYGGETVALRENPGISELDDQELRSLNRVIAEYGGLSSKELSEKSHRESVWKDRIDGDNLPYSEASSVKMVQALLAQDG